LTGGKHGCRAFGSRAEEPLDQSDDTAEKLLGADLTTFYMGRRCHYFHEHAVTCTADNDKRYFVTACATIDAQAPET
jgi:hypothetical protein